MRWYGWFQKYILQKENMVNILTNGKNGVFIEVPPYVVKRINDYYAFLDDGESYWSDYIVRNDWHQIRITLEEEREFNKLNNRINNLKKEFRIRTEKTFDASLAGDVIKIGSFATNLLRKELTKYNSHTREINSQFNFVLREFNREYNESKSKKRLSTRDRIDLLEWVFAMAAMVDIRYYESEGIRNEDIPKYSERYPQYLIGTLAGISGWYRAGEDAKRGMYKRFNILIDKVKLVSNLLKRTRK